MPPQKSFVIKQSTPEADKLERRVHNELKEIWDPAADATVAKYVTAMLAKGYDRKKMVASLKGILHESTSEKLVAWLYPHLRKHGNDYQSKEPPASIKSVPKPPPSAAKVAPTEEVELILEDLEAQQLEGSDLEDDVDAHDTATALASTAVAEAMPIHKSTADHAHQRNRGGSTEQDVQTQRTGRTAQAPHGSGQNGRVAEPGEMSERSDRRHREPIPVPFFTEQPRSLSSGGTTRSTQQRGVTSVAATAVAQPHHPSEQIWPDEQNQAREEQPPAAESDHRRLKSTVVLDWDAWHKQKQPTDEQPTAKPVALPDKSAVPERVPILPRAAQEAAVLPLKAPTSPRKREDGRERERERERSHGSGADKRKQSASVGGDRQGLRHRDGDGDESVRRGHEREGEGPARRRGRNAVHCSRSRSRSRSPRARRSGRAPLVTANLLRSALREVDSLAGGTTSRGSKPSVFDRLGAGSGPGDAVLVRAPALQRLSGPDKADRTMDTSGSGRKRGPEGTVYADPDVLASPPKSARGMASQKLNAAGRSSAGQQAEAQASAHAVKTAPGPGKLRIEFPSQIAPTAPARQPSTGQAHGSTTAPVAAGPSPGERAGNQSTAAAPAAAAPPQVAEGAVDPKAAELDELRQQMAEMAEKLARMEAAKDVPPQATAQSQPQQLQSELQLQVQPRPQPVLMPFAPDKSSFQSQSSQQLQPRSIQPPARPQAVLLPQAQQQQRPAQLSDSQQRSITARLQAPHAGLSSSAVMGVRPSGMASMGRGNTPLGSVPVASSDVGGRSSGPGGASIRPTSMSGVIIEGGSGSPPRWPAMQPPETQPRKADEQRLAAAQFEADLRSVVVENVHFLASEQVLAAHFSVVGPVKKITIVHDKLSRRPTSVAIVEMATEQATQAAVALSGSPLMELPIVVTLKAALMLQGFNFARFGMGAAGPVLRAMMPSTGTASAGGGPTGRLNAAAPPFVPGVAPAGIGLGRGVGGILGAGVRPPVGTMGSGGRQPWPVAGGRGRGSNVWVRDQAKPANRVADHS